jgi:hypothetical protein
VESSSQGLGRELLLGSVIILGRGRELNLGSGIISKMPLVDGCIGRLVAASD